MKFRREFKLMLTCTTRANYYYRSNRTTMGTGFPSEATTTLGGQQSRKQSTTMTTITATAARPRGNSLQYTSCNSINKLGGQVPHSPTRPELNNSYLSPMHALVGYGQSQNKKRNALVTSVSMSKFENLVHNEVEKITSVVEDDKDGVINKNDNNIKAGQHQNNASSKLIKKTNSNLVETTTQ